MDIRNDHFLPLNQLLLDQGHGRLQERDELLGRIAPQFRANMERQAPIAKARQGRPCAWRWKGR
jgi:hypothetical protein